MLTLRRLDHFGVDVVDLERAERFYTEVLGMGVRMRLPDQVLLRYGDGSCALFLKPGRVPGGLEQIAHPLGQSHHAFEVSHDDLGRALELFKARGIPHHAPIDWGDHDCLYFLDPDGNLLELVGYRRETTEEEHTMASEIVNELRKKSDAMWGNLTRELQGMEPHLERSDAPGEWTTRQVLAHLLSDPGWNPVDTLKTFADRDLPVIELRPGRVTVNDERRAMTLEQFMRALDTRRREVFAYLDGLTDAQLRRKARIPVLKQFLGTEEIDLPTYAGLILERHWGDHLAQLGKIRKAVGL